MKTPYTVDYKEWTYTDALFSDKGAYDFWKFNDFKFKVRISDPQWLCDSLNELEYLRDFEKAITAIKRDKENDLAK